MRFVMILLPSTLLGAGCQTYERAPLDLASHRAAWETRTPGDDAVRRFADDLRRLDGRPADGYDPTDGLSLAEAELVALVYNPDLRMARLEAGVQAASAEHAGLWDDPELGLEILRITDGGSDPWDIPLGLSFTIPLSGRLEVEKARADAEAAAALERVAAQEWRTVQDLRRAWLRWSARRLESQLTAELVAGLESYVGTTRRLSEAGELPRTEATLFAIEQASRRNELIALEGEVGVHEQAIRSILGIAPDASVELHPAVVAADPPPAGDDTLDRLAATSGDLAVLRAEYEVAEHALHREIRKQFPDLTIGPAYAYDEGQSKIGVGLGIPIPFLNANRRGIAEARARRDLARAAFETGFERLAGRLAAARARHDAAVRQRDDVETTLVPLVDDQVGDARRLMELGEGTALVLLESVVRAHETKLRLIEARQTEAEAVVEMLEILGPDEVGEATP